MKRKRKEIENEGEDGRDKEDSDELYKKIVEEKDFNSIGKLLEETEGIRQEDFSILKSAERVFSHFFTTGKLRIFKPKDSNSIQENKISLNQVGKPDSTLKVENWILEQYETYISLLIEKLVNKSIPTFLKNKILKQILTFSKFEFHHGSKFDNRVLPPQQLLDNLSLKSSIGKTISCLIDQRTSKECVTEVIERMREIIFSHLDLKLVLLNTLNKSLQKEQENSKKKRKKKKKKRKRRSSGVSLQLVLAFVDKLIIVGPNETENTKFDFSKLFFLNFKPFEKSGKSRKKKRKMSGRRVPSGLVLIDFRKQIFQTFWIRFITMLRPEHVVLKRILFARMKGFVLPYLGDPNMVGPFIARPLDTFPVLPPGMGYKEVILSLECIFELITKHGYSFEPYYVQLYKLVSTEFIRGVLSTLGLDVSCGESFFRILYLSLQSPKIPEVFISCFVKKLFRVCLYVDISWLVRYTCFVSYRMLRSHKSLRSLIHKQSVVQERSNEEKRRLFGTINQGLLLSSSSSNNNNKEEEEEGLTMKKDPFDENETKNLFLTKAEESSLWEIDTLENSVDPTTVEIIRRFKKLIAVGNYSGTVGGTFEGVMLMLKDIIDTGMGREGQEEVEEEFEEEIPLEYNLEKSILPM